MPIGELHSLPIGMLLLALHFAEGELLALGYAFERGHRARRPLRFLPTISP